MFMVKFIHNGLETIAIAKYNGKTYKASAKCDPEDDFDDEYGEDLAEIRLMKKIAKVRSKFLTDRLAQAIICSVYWQHEIDELKMAQKKAFEDFAMFEDIEKDIIERE